jgi:hypothetical protein
VEMGRRAASSAAAALYGALFIIFLLIAISGVVALWQLLAPIWTSGSPAPSSQATDTGAELRAAFSSSAPC